MRTTDRSQALFYENKKEKREGLNPLALLALQLADEFLGGCQGICRFPTRNHDLSWPDFTNQSVVRPGGRVGYIRTSKCLLGYGVNHRTTYSYQGAYVRSFTVQHNQRGKVAVTIRNTRGYACLVAGHYHPGQTPILYPTKTGEIIE